MVMVGALAISIIWSILLVLDTTKAATRPVNRTIDDTYGDEKTGVPPKYFPLSVGVWANQDNNGRIRPDPIHAFKNTFMSSTYHPEYGNTSVTFDFVGFAIYIYFTTVDDSREFITSKTECNFTIDGHKKGYYNHDPDLLNPGFQYQQLVFFDEHLTNGPHTFSIVTSGLSYHVYTNLDYAMYTTEEEIIEPPATTQPPSSPPPSTTPSTSKSNNASLIGGIVGGVVSFVAVIILLIWVLLRKPSKRRHQVEDPPPYYSANSNGIPWTIQSSSSKGATESRNVTSTVLARINFFSKRSTAAEHARRWSSAPHNTEQEELRSQRQNQLTERLRVMMEEMQVLQDDLCQESVTLDPSDNQGNISDSGLMLRAQIMNMEGQITQLRELFQSSWAMGLTDDPPPEYTL